MRFLTCPKCSGKMIEGFLPDYTYGAVLQNKWVEGKPEKSFWTGTKVKDKEQFTVKTYRCADCGLLESYAAIEETSASPSIFE